MDILSSPVGVRVEPGASGGDGKVRLEVYDSAQIHVQGTRREADQRDSDDRAITLPHAIFRDQC